jgi:hypothetical protein
MGGSFLVKYLKNPIVILLVLIILVVGMNTIGKSMEGYVPPQNPAEFAATSIGETVLSGDRVVDSSKVRKVPVVYHPEYLIEDLKNNEFSDFFTALTTGSVETPINKITAGNVSRYGVARGFTGPGMITASEDKLIVNAPGTFVWGFKTPYTSAVRTENGINITTENKTVKTVAAADISNSTVTSNYVTVEELKEWYKNADVGDKIGLDFSISTFNDGRNTVPPSKILSYFGNDTLKYMSEYPSGSPVMVYNGATNQKIAGTGSSMLESFPEYNDNIRAANAREFVRGWNNTIIPPNTSTHGKEDVSFEGVYDPEASGYPTHGVCPPGRSLRAAVMSAGFPLPSGMNSGYYSVSLDSSPTTGISLYNPTDYPVKIIFWTEGSGPSMMMYAQAVQYIP